MSYIENPKTKGSGIFCSIPQKGPCKVGCEDCFFESGRSYLEPREENLPNVPSYSKTLNRVVRVNDGNDSSMELKEVLRRSSIYQHLFFNTIFKEKLDEFPAPVVLTLNPGPMTNENFHKINKKAGKNLMFVRFRVNTWNLDLLGKALKFYKDREFPVILTFMAYHKIDSIKEGHRENYISRTRTKNEYFAITTEAWRKIMAPYEGELLIYSCGKIEGEKGDTHCRYCGNCLREYFATRERHRLRPGFSWR